MIDRVEVASLLTALGSDLVDLRKQARRRDSINEAVDFLIDAFSDKLGEVLETIQSESHCCGHYIKQ